MRRLIAVSAFGLLLAVPVWAQRGGGHGGGFGGGRGGFGGGHAGFAGHGFSGGHMGGGHLSGGHVSGRNFSGRSGFSHGFTHSSRTAFSRFPRSHDNIRERLHFRNHCFGWNCRGFGSYPWWGWGYYDPFLWGWWDHDSNYDQDSERERAYADQLNAENIELQRMLRQEQEDRDEDAYGRRSYQAPPPPLEAKEQAPEPATPTVLVFRDQHKQEVSNYAIVGQTLWAFVPQHHQKIPLAELDIPATVKANDDRGVTFRVPAS